MIYLLLLYSMMIMSSLMAISSTNWIMIWLSMELNLLSFIPLLLSYKSDSNNEGAMNYFMSQAIGSSMILMSSIMISNFYWKPFMITMLFMSLLLKLGAVPCHFWFPVVMNSTSWMNCILLSTWQKILPLFIIGYIMPNNSMMKFIAPINALYGGCLGLNQMSMKKIMAYSSITHMGWAMSGMIMKMPCLMISYFIMYSIIVTPVFLFMMKLSNNSTSNLWSSLSNSNNLHLLLMFLMLMSLGGLPPMSGFIPKMIMISMLLKYSIPILLILIIGSLLNLYFYLNISMNSFLNKMNMSMHNKMTNSILSTMAIMINLFGFFIIML